MFSSHFSESQRTRSVATAGTCSTFFIHFITGLLKALQLIYLNGSKGLRVREGRKKSSYRYILLKIGEKSILPDQPTGGAIAPTAPPLDPPLYQQRRCPTNSRCRYVETAISGSV